jgi:hypothetical protein
MKPTMKLSPGAFHLVVFGVGRTWHNGAYNVNKYVFLKASEVDEFTVTSAILVYSLLRACSGRNR